MTCLLDTNVVSEFRKRAPDPTRNTSDVASSGVRLLSPFRTTSALNSGGFPSNQRA